MHARVNEGKKSIARQSRTQAFGETFAALAQAVCSTEKW